MVPQPSAQFHNVANPGKRPDPDKGTVLALVLSGVVVLGGCGGASPADRAEAKTGHLDAAKAGARAAAAAGETRSDQAQRVVAPPPEPTPPRAELAHEVPDIVAKMEADPAYVGIWEADRREDLDVFLTGVSALLAEGAISKRVVTELKTRGLNPLVEAVGRVVLRTGKLPAPIVAKFAAHLDATAAEDNAGLWLPTSADTVRDYTVVAAYAKPEDAGVLRQLLAARSAGSWVRWHDANTTPKRPWLSTEIGALERLQQLDELTAVEQARLASLTAPVDASESRDIRAEGYTGYDDAGDPMPLTDEEIAIAIEYGTALFKNAQAGHVDERSEAEIAQRLARKHKLRVEVLDAIWDRGNALQDRRVLSGIRG